MTTVVEPPVDVVSTPARARRQARPLELGLVVLPIVIALVAARPLGDPDTWWHLRTGELVLAEGLVDADPWSFASTRAWVLHEWLPEVLFYAAYSVAGYAGVVAVTSLVVLAFAGVLMASCRRVAQPLIACVAFALAAVATMPSLGPRPQLLSWLLLAAVCPYLRTCTAARRLPWWLLPVLWVWASVHGLWLMALVLFGFLICGLAVEEGLRGWRVTARFGGFGILAWVVVALSPSGPALLLAPFHVREYAGFVAEWNPPSITHPAVACALVLVLVVVIGWTRQSRVPATTIAFVVGATAMGMLYSRTVPVAAIALAPLAAAAAQGWSHQAPPRFRLDRRELGTWAAVLVLTVPVFGLRLADAGQADPAAPSPTTNAALRAATERLQDLPGRARVLNEYQLGGWLLWSARNVSPTIDGRADVYSVEHFHDYVDALAMRPGWEEFVGSLDADGAVLFRETPLSAGLVSLGWTVVQEDEGLVVLLAPAAVSG